MERIAALTANLLEAYRRGVNLSEGYSYAKARENQILNDARANTGLVAGTAAELLGGSVAGWWAWSCQVYYLADVVIPAGVSRTCTNLGCGYSGPRRHR